MRQFYLRLLKLFQNDSIEDNSSSSASTLELEKKNLENHLQELQFIENELKEFKAKVGSNNNINTP